MGIWEAFSDVVEAVMPWSVVEAEAPAEEIKEEEVAVEVKEESPAEEPEAEAEPEKEKEEEEAEEEEEEEEKEEEEEEAETVDYKVVYEKECEESTQCAPVKHHFDECVERVHQQESAGEVTEDCVEEFFHLAHCATACAAPKLWSKLR